MRSQIFARKALTLIVVASLFAVTGLAFAQVIRSPEIIFKKGTTGSGCKLNGLSYVNGQVVKVDSTDAKGGHHTIELVCTASGWIKG